MADQANDDLKRTVLHDWHAGHGANPNISLLAIADCANHHFSDFWSRKPIHYGRPIIKVDPTTGRIDLHGPVVNAAARVSDAGHESSPK